MAINQDKLRMLRIMQILMQETDEQHPLSAAKIGARLESKYDMTCDRKTIYSDIELLDEIGLEVVHTPSRRGGFYVSGRQFELPELKLLVDAVQSSK
ncbi:MAG: WYL domain-containing protein, partial [Blautia sp.]|nr:WYL domain-containing protein [Blautia sp.]